MAQICIDCSKLSINGIFSGYCDELTVVIEGAAGEKQSELSGTYAIESELVNGRATYTSLDGKFAIAYSPSGYGWYIQPVDHR